jgi:hypothetical protein
MLYANKPASLRIILQNLVQHRLMQGGTVRSCCATHFNSHSGQKFQLATTVGKICCDNITALGQVGKAQKYVSTGMKHSDLHHAILTLKCSSQLDMKYSHVRAHQDRILPWSMLTLEQQLNVICDGLVNDAIARYLACGSVRDNGPYFLLFEKAAAVLDGVKLTTDVGPEVCIQLGMEEAERFYTKPAT